MRGRTPASVKKICADIQIETAGAAMLKSSRWSSLRRRFSHREIIKPSRATMRVPTGAPNSRTEVMTKVSETERLAGIEGSLTLAEPLIIVNAARISHSYPTGERHRSYVDAVT